MQIISRDDARAKGFKRFFSGIPCRRGHICERYVRDYTCILCSQRPERKALIKAYDQKHKKARKAYFRKWKAENKARVNELGCLWAKRNPEKHAARSRLRRARQLNVEGSHTAEEIQDLLKKQKRKCASCLVRLKDEYEADHIFPVSKPGSSNHITNMQILCILCNRRKNAKDPFKWALENGRLL